MHCKCHQFCYIAKLMRIYDNIRSVCKAHSKRDARCPVIWVQNFVDILVLFLCHFVSWDYILWKWICKRNNRNFITAQSEQHFESFYFVYSWHCSGFLASNGIFQKCFLFAILSFNSYFHRIKKIIAEENKWRRIINQQEIEIIKCAPFSVSA